MNNDYFKNNSLNEFFNKNVDFNDAADMSLNALLKNNIGKKVVIYQTFSDTKDEHSGIIERCDSDYIILSDPNSGNWYLFFVKYINFIKFDEEINLNY